MTANLWNDGDQANDDADERLIAALSQFDAELDCPSATISHAGETLDDALRVKFERLSEVLTELARLRETEAATNGCFSAGAAAEEVSAQIGRFEIVRELGRGGHGIVFLARDPLLARQVALKVPRPELLFSRGSRERFVREGRSTAALSHPNLITVFEAGEAGTVCYLAQEYCEGPNLDEWMRRRAAPVPPRLAAGLVAQLAEGIEHAHRHGIVHRDLKPGNVLMQPRSAAAGSSASHTVSEETEWTPRIVDFGLARLTEAQDALTATGAMLGTPAFMAPEQLDSQYGIVGERSDVYALGGILYQVLMGHPPFAGASHSELIKHALLDQPRGIRAQRRNVPKDLEAICLHALEKRPVDRYSSAADLAADLRHFLGGEPTFVRPLGAAAQLLKWARRSPWQAGLLFTAASAMTAILAVLIWANLRLTQAIHTAQQQEEIALRRAQELRERAYASDMRLLDDNQLQLSLIQADRILDEYRPRSGEPDLRGFDWWVHWHRYHGDLPSREIGRHDGGTSSATVNAAGDIAATGGNDGFIRIWSLPSGERIHNIKAHLGNVNALTFQTGSARLVSAGDDAVVRIWDTERGTLIKELRGHAGWVAALQFLPDGRLASGAADGTIIVWNLEAGQPVTRLTGHTKPVRSLALFDRMNLLVSASEDATIRAWDMLQLKPWTEIGEAGLPNPLAPRWVRQLAFEPDQQTLSGIYFGQSVIHWRTGRGFDKVRSISGTEAATRCVAFAGDPRDPEMVVGLANGTILRTKPVHLDDHVLRIRGLASSVEAVALSPDGRQLVSGSKDGEVRHWPDIQANQRVMHSPWPFPAAKLAISPSGEWLAWNTDDSLQVVDFKSLRPVCQQPVANSPPRALVFDPRQSGLVVLYADEVHWQPFDGELQKMGLEDGFDSRGCLVHEQSGRVAVFGRGGAVIVSLEPLRVLARLPHPESVGGIAFLPENQIVTASHDGMLRVWTNVAPSPTRTLDIAAGSLGDLCLSPNRKLLAVRAERQVVFLDVKSLHVLGSVPQLGEDGRLAFLAGGRTLVTQNVGSANRLWNVANLQPTGRLLELDSYVDFAASFNGWRLAAVSENILLRIDATPPEPALAATRE